MSMMEMKLTDSLFMGAKEQETNHYVVKLSNGVDIHVYKDAVYPSTGTVWGWKVDGQYFDHDEYALKYLEKIIAEKLTGNRIVYHARREVPDICGCEEFLQEHANDSWGCHAQRDGRFSNLCSSCPIAEQLEAKRDGVEIIYAM